MTTIWVFGLAALAAIVLVLALVTRAAKHGMQKHPLPKLAYRWLTGLPWHGRDPVPDATWLHRGSEEANVNGQRIRPFFYRCRLARTVIRLAETAIAWTAIVLLVWWGLNAPLSLALTVLAVAVIAGGLAGWTGVRWVKVWKQRVEPSAQLAVYKSRAVAALPSPARWEANRELYRPMHYRAHHHAGIPPAFRPRRWIEIAPDRQTVTLTIPDGLDTTKAIGALHQVVSQTVFCDNKPDCTPQMAGRRRQLVYTAAKPPPPSLVLLDPDSSRNALGIRHLIEKAAWHELVLGYGVGEVPVIRSLGKAVPHWGLSMPSGDGKSVCAELLAAQMLFHGAVCLVLDYKVFSHPWALFAMPNVSYAGTTEQIHLTLLWLKDEANERKKRGLEFIQLDGSFAGDVGPVIFVVAEELNATITELKSYWKSIDGSGESPAVSALREMLFTGRALKIHFLLIAQKLTVASLGGKDSAARENCAGILMGGSASAPSWKMLADDVERPAKQSVPGRHFVVDHGNVTLCQVAYLNPSGKAGPEARQLALQGTVTALPEGIPLGIAKPITPSIEYSGHSGHVSDVMGRNGRPDRRELETRPSGSAVTDPSAQVLMGLREACQEGVLPCSLSNAQIRRARDPKFPEPVPGVIAARGEKMYVAGELHEYGRMTWGERDTGKRIPAEVINLNAARRAPAQDDAPKEPPAPAVAPGPDSDLLVQAARLVIEFQHGSVAMLNRKLRVGWNDAQQLMSELERQEIVGQDQGDKPRDVLVPAHALDVTLGELREAANA